MSEPVTTEEAVGSTFGRAVAAAVSKALGPRLLPARDLSPGVEWKEILFSAPSTKSSADYVESVAAAIAGLASEDRGLRFGRLPAGTNWPPGGEVVVDHGEVVLRLRVIPGPFGASFRVRFAVDPTGKRLPARSQSPIPVPTKEILSK